MKIRCQILLVFVLLMTLPAVVQAQFVYTTNNNAITITGWTGTPTTLTIPSSITGLPVTSIGNRSFENCTSLTSVAIPSSVTNIGAFAFYDCTSLTAISVDTNNLAYSSEGEVLFNNTQMTIIQYPLCRAGTSYTIPSSVINIGDYAFDRCTSLTSVAIPSSVTSINPGAFSFCSSLTNIGIPNSVTSIGQSAFLGCSSLASVAIPKSLDTINHNTFHSCGSLTNVIIPNNTITNIRSGAFMRCTNLTSIVIPNSVSTIDSDAFRDCISLKAVFFQGNSPSISSRIFYHASPTVYYLANTTGWGATFSGCPTALIEFHYTITQNVNTLTDYIGAGGTVVIPDDINSLPVTSIANSAFAYCSTVTSITIPNSVTNIGANAFFGCTRLTSVTIPNTIKSIGANTFQWCDSLSSITIPSSVTNIGGFAFFGCTSLTEVHFTGNAPTIGSFLFTYANPVVYYLPGTTGWGTTFGGCPTALWFLPNPLILNNDSRLGVGTNLFGFGISWAAHNSVVVEACTDTNPTWSPVSTNTLTNGSSYFNDPKWTNFTQRYYRLRSP